MFSTIHKNLTCKAYAAENVRNPFYYEEQGQQNKCIHTRPRISGFFQTKNTCKSKYTSMQYSLMQWSATPDMGDYLKTRPPYERPFEVLEGKLLSWAIYSTYEIKRKLHRHIPFHILALLSPWWVWVFPGSLLYHIYCILLVHPPKYLKVHVFMVMKYRN